MARRTTAISRGGSKQQHDGESPPGRQAATAGPLALRGGTLRAAADSKDKKTRSFQEMTTGCKPTHVLLRRRGRLLETGTSTLLCQNLCSCCLVH